jgi:hypothetical protein
MVITLNNELLASPNQLNVHVAHVAHGGNTFQPLYINEYIMEN